MSTKAKVVISIIAICVILTVIVLSIVLVFASPAMEVNSSSIVIEYSSGNVFADIDIKRQDVNLYQSGEGNNSTMVDTEDICSLSTVPSNSNVTTKAHDLGVFNRGQYVDITEANTTLLIDVVLDNNNISDRLIVGLYYDDTFEVDQNVRIVVKSVMYTKTGTSYTLPDKTTSMVDGLWETNKILDVNGVSLSNNGYNKISIRCDVEVVSYSENARLDGEFKLALTSVE